MKREALPSMEVLSILKCYTACEEPLISKCIILIH